MFSSVPTIQYHCTVNVVNVPLIEDILTEDHEEDHAMGKKQEPEIPVTPSSGNVFADLGFAEPEEELAKAKPRPERAEFD
jgi:hypothetical protein